MNTHIVIICLVHKYAVSTYNIESENLYTKLHNYNNMKLVSADQNLKKFSLKILVEEPKSQRTCLFLQVEKLSNWP